MDKNTYSEEELLRRKRHEIAEWENCIPYKCEIDEIRLHHKYVTMVYGHLKESGKKIVWDEFGKASWMYPTAEGEKAENYNVKWYD